MSSQVVRTRHSLPTQAVLMLSTLHLQPCGMPHHWLLIGCRMSSAHCIVTENLGSSSPSPSPSPFRVLLFFLRNAASPAPSLLAAANTATCGITNEAGTRLRTGEGRTVAPGICGLLHYLVLWETSDGAEFAVLLVPVHDTEIKMEHAPQQKHATSTDINAEQRHHVPTGAPTARFCERLKKK